jgi:hypothetical protein
VRLPWHEREIHTYLYKILVSLNIFVSIYGILLVVDATALGVIGKVACKHALTDLESKSHSIKLMHGQSRIKIKARRS